MYCTDCMKMHFEVKINDGCANGLFCPEDQCETTAVPNQVGKDIFVSLDCCESICIAYPSVYPPSLTSFTVGWVINPVKSKG